MIVSCVGVGKYVSGAVRYVEMSWPKLNFPNLASTSFLAASSAYIFVPGRYTMLVRCHKCRKRSADLKGGFGATSDPNFRIRLPVDLRV